ncbi:hypothetical protein BGZ95_007923, partial [Linnemannia exigua]
TIKYALGWLQLNWQSLQNPPVKIDKRMHTNRASSWSIEHPDGRETDDAKENWNQSTLHDLPQHEEDIPLVE